MATLTVGKYMLSIVPDTGAAGCADPHALQNRPKIIVIYNKMKYNQINKLKVVKEKI